MVEFKRTAPIFIFLALMTIKVSAFHVYTHQDVDSQVENCAYCDVAIENQQAEHVPILMVTADVQEPIEKKEPKLFSKTNVIVGNTYHSYLFCRPPPVI